MAEKRFTLEDLYRIDPNDLPKGARPFEEGEFVDNGDGTRSTERAASFNIEGKEVLVPTLWMTERGPTDLSRNVETLMRAVREYEMRSGKKFPRFNTVKEADEWSRQRSSGGAVFTGPLAR